MGLAWQQDWETAIDIDKETVLAKRLGSVWRATDIVKAFDLKEKPYYEDELLVEYWIPDEAVQEIVGRSQFGGATS